MSSQASYANAMACRHTPIMNSGLCFKTQVNELLQMQFRLIVQVHVPKARRRNPLLQPSDCTVEEHSRPPSSAFNWNAYQENPGFQFTLTIIMESNFFRFLKIVGVGYKARAEAEGGQLFLKLGYSHEVELTVPPAVRVFCFKNNVVCCTGIDKQRVHQFAAAVRSCKPPEVYKGKGIMYIDEVIKKKQGKKSK
ncbi:60S ribosomal protein L6 mitochondrial [Tripterygium wilfordii]|uniref:60S ribosomal protein L6 mitochondrial n=1 Tax=Tripterygium wilfordii TaxID=458696 RepID=A0A7J7E2U7_TRIWF|nr:60S ribosomal protein L6, mitochondrial-like [Tripterygium wilfordii]KAF5752982.1 60S ribosomal protein L6 mitochondrial [Tripterygium wilfordii]